MLPVLDLFSGIGGFSLGLERTGGFRTVAFCEIEPYCRSVLGRHWPDVPVFEDVRLLSADLLEFVGIERPRVICGGFPCQDISLAGKGAGLGGERSGLWYEYHRLIEEIRPDFAIIENVSALRSRGLDAVLGSLAAIGYDAEWHCVSASAVGAPHRRDRVWIVAYPARNVLAEQASGRAERERIGQGSESVTAHPDANRRRQQECSQLDGDTSQDPADRSSCGQHTDGLRDALPDAIVVGLQGLSELDAGKRARGPILAGSAIARAYSAHRSDGGWWESEPDVGRVAHGVPARVHRLRALGNAVVPQIPEILGRAILERLNE